IGSSLKAMERVPFRTARLPDELHAALVKELVPLPHVAREACAHDVVPGRLSAARDRNDVIERQLGRRELLPAVLAAIVVAEIDVTARELHFLARQPVEEQ